MLAARVAELTGWQQLQLAAVSYIDSGEMLPPVCLDCTLNKLVHSYIFYFDFLLICAEQVEKLNTEVK